MPNYDYECPECGHVKELRAGMSHVVIESSCRECSETRKFVRVFSPSKSFVLKGKGWYATEYGNKRKSRKD